MKSEKKPCRCLGVCLEDTARTGRRCIGFPLDLKTIPVDHPDSRVWRRNDGALLPFPNGGTRAEWQVIADASIERAAHLPND